MPQVLSPQDKDQWARSPATEAFVWQLREVIADTKERWAQGHYNGDSDAETLRLTAQAVSQIDMLRQVIDVVEELKIVPNLEGETEDDTSDS
jgi:hypothetical protein